MLRDQIHRIVEAYIGLVDWIAAATGFEDRLLHVHAGLLILLIARVVTRRPLSSPVPLACVCIAELVNEIFDRLYHGRWMPDTTSDVINTLLWPLAIFVLTRWMPGKARGRSRR
ncbi:hypothetical protein [Sphingomonas sp. Root710]|uniref:hypothetical protein n=1 Tax=Sphingomonas sp. Root710 TaxID=1736594 RepID=UPI000A9A44EA|nr:hypothetical protein [Sphingomonas sp. Root710]